MKYYFLEKLDETVKNIIGIESTATGRQWFIVQYLIVILFPVIRTRAIIMHSRTLGRQSLYKKKKKIANTLNIAREVVKVRLFKFAMTRY